MDAHRWTLILLALGAVGLLVALVTGAKLNPFLALLAASLAMGAAAGVNLLRALSSFQEGMGATLGGIAAVIALGVMLGKLLAESGGAEELARRFAVFFGPSRAGWCIMALALAIGLTTWFAVGLVLLLPILLTLARETRRPLLLLALPMLSILSVMHGLMPPHPGPVIAIRALGASTGLVLLWGLIIGLPTAAIAGPFFARWAVRRVHAEVPIALLAAGDRPERRTPPGFGLTLVTMLLPVGFLLLGAVCELALPKDASLARSAGAVLGHPTVALAIAVVFALWSLGTRCGFARTELLKFSEESIAGVGMTILVIGAGGGFARVMNEAGVADALGSLAHLMNLPPIVYAWAIAAFIRVATGSATVAITTASGLLGPLLLENPHVHRELLVISIGCGSLFLSHLNDGGFWMVKDCLGLTVSQTLRTWTVTETLIGLAGLLLTLLADWICQAAERGFHVL